MCDSGNIRRGGVAAIVPLAMVLIAAAVISGAAHAQSTTKPDAPGAASAPAKPPAAPETPPLTAHVAGADGQIWVVRVPGGSAGASAKRGEFVVLHRAGDDEPKVIYRAIAGKGELTHVAAWGSTLWCLYSDRSVQAIRYRPADKSMPRTYETVQQQPLTGEGDVIGWSAGAAGPVALIRRPEAPVEPGTPPTDEDPAPTQDPAPPNPDDADGEPAAEPAPSGEPEAAPAKAADSPAETDPPKPAAAPLPPPSPIRLLQLDTTGWRDIAIPRSLRSDLLAGLLMRSDDSYALVSDHRPETPAFTAHIYQSGNWTDHTFAVSLGDKAKRDVQLVGVGGNLLVIKATSDRTRWRLVPQHLYPGEIKQLGAINTRRNAVGWWAMPGDGSVEVVDVDAAGVLSWARRVIGDTSYAPVMMTELTVSDPPPLLPTPMTIVMIGALVIGMLFMLGGSRREPAKVVLVPRGTKPAGSVRIFAALIDLAPAVAASMFIHKIPNPVELFTRWADHPDEWRQMAPWLLVVGVFVVHTTVTELFTGATLGKLLLNMRVIGMDGRPPNVWQVLARNAFKAIELLPPFVLLMLPVLNRYHQRLGDMVARTLVIGPDPDAARRRKEDEDELFRDDDDEGL